MMTFRAKCTPADRRLHNDRYGFLLVLTDGISLRIGLSPLGLLSSLFGIET